MERLNKIWIEGESYHLSAKEVKEMNEYAFAVPKSDPTWGERRAAEWLLDNEFQSDQSELSTPEEILKLKEAALEQTEKTMKLQKAEVEKARKKLKGGTALVALLLGVAYLLDYLFPMQGDFQIAELIGALITGAGVPTTFSGRAECDDTIIIGDIDTACPLSGISVDIDGKSRINIQGSQPIVSAFMKFMGRMTAGSIVALALKVATGKITAPTTYRFTNNGATTPNIFTSSSGANGAPFEASTIGINALDNKDFENFTALFISPSANVASIDIDYEDGHHEAGMNVIDVDGLLTMTQDTEANGRLDAVVTAIDNRPGTLRPIRKVRVNATTAVTVCIMKMADEDFKRLTS